MITCNRVRDVLLTSEIICPNKGRQNLSSRSQITFLKVIRICIVHLVPVQLRSDNAKIKGKLGYKNKSLTLHV